jgi:hypothetical protein
MSDWTLVTLYLTVLPIILVSLTYTAARYF